MAFGASSWKLRIAGEEDRKLKNRGLGWRLALPIPIYRRFLGSRAHGVSNVYSRTAFRLRALKKVRSIDHTVRLSITSSNSRWRRPMADQSLHPDGSLHQVDLECRRSYSSHPVTFERIRIVDN